MASIILKDIVDIQKVFLSWNIARDSETLSGITVLDF